MVDNESQEFIGEFCVANWESEFQFDFYFIEGFDASLVVLEAVELEDEVIWEVGEGDFLMSLGLCFAVFAMEFQCFFAEVGVDHGGEEFALLAFLHVETEREELLFLD